MTEILLDKITFEKINQCRLHFHVCHNSFKIDIGDTVTFFKKSKAKDNSGKYMTITDSITVNVLNIVTKIEGLQIGYFIFEFTT